MKNAVLHVRLIYISFFLYSNVIYSSEVSDDIPYLTYRDFAENKGVFKPGESNIKIFNKSGDVIGELKSPMPDFSSVARGGFATLISPSYIVSVKHNTGYKSVQFGGSGNNPDYNRYSYKIVNRNNNSKLDFHVPRLDKIVVDTSSIFDFTRYGSAVNTYKNSDLFSDFYRVGGGSQFIRSKDGVITSLSLAYNYLTGGVLNAPTTSNAMLSFDAGNMYSQSSSILPTYSTPGDSGSPIFAFDKKNNKWILIAVLATYAGAGKITNTATVLPSDFIDEVMNGNDLSAIELSSSTNATWISNASSGLGVLNVNGFDYSTYGNKNGDLDFSKNITLTGNGNILLNSSVDLGAGSITFNGNNLISSSSNEFSWKGGGLIVNEGSFVIWRVNGELNDALHKLGKGTLLVNATGVNKGDLRVGDGVVILDQMPDENGNNKAFKSISLTGGGANVILKGKDQVDPDNIYFGYRGGSLNLHGHDLKVKKINAVDNGARIYNDYNSKSTVYIKSYGLNDVSFFKWDSSGIGTPGNIYEYFNKSKNMNEYYELLSNKYGYFPSGGVDNASWKYLGVDKDSVVSEHLIRKNKIVFPGQFNGNLSINYNPDFSYGVLGLTGDSKFSDLSIHNGTVVVSGEPSIHADGSINEYHWVRNLSLIDSISVYNNAAFQLGTHGTIISNVASSFDKSILNIGNKKGITYKCLLSDITGRSSCLISDDSSSYNDKDKSVYYGNLNVFDDSVLNFGDVNYFGSINAKNKKSVTIMQGGTKLFLSGSNFIENGIEVDSESGNIYDWDITLLPESKLRTSFLNSKNISIKLNDKSELSINNNSHINKIELINSRASIDNDVELSATFISDKQSIIDTFQSSALTLKDGSSLKGTSLIGSGFINMDGKVDVFGSSYEYNGDVNILPGSIVSVDDVASLGFNGNIYINGSSELKFDLNNYTMTDVNDVFIFNKNVVGDGEINVMSGSIFAPSALSMFMGKIKVDKQASLYLSDSSVSDVLGKDNIISGFGQFFIDVVHDHVMNNEISDGIELIKLGSGGITFKDSDIKRFNSIVINDGSVRLNNSVEDVSAVINSEGTAQFGGHYKSIVNKGVLRVQNEMKSKLSTVIDYLDGRGGVFDLRSYDGVTNVLVGKYQSAGDKIMINSWGNVSDSITVSDWFDGYAYLYVSNDNDLYNNDGSAVSSLKVINCLNDCSANLILKSRLTSGAYEYLLMKSDDGYYLTKEIFGHVDNLIDSSNPAGINVNVKTSNFIIRPEVSGYFLNAMSSEKFFLNIDTLKKKGEGSDLWIDHSNFIGSGNLFKQIDWSESSEITSIGWHPLTLMVSDVESLKIGAWAGYGTSNALMESIVSGYKSNGFVKGYNVGVYVFNDFNNFNNSGFTYDLSVNHLTLDNIVSGVGVNTDRYRTTEVNASGHVGYSVPIYKVDNKVDVYASPYLSIKCSFHDKNKNRVNSNDEAISINKSCEPGIGVNTGIGVGDYLDMTAGISIKKKNKFVGINFSNDYFSSASDSIINDLSVNANYKINKSLSIVAGAGVSEDNKKASFGMTFSF